MTSFQWLVLVALLLVGWFGGRALARGLRARKTETVVHGDFAVFAREALVNAAKIDGRVDPRERAAIAAALAELKLEAGDIEADLAAARLSKDELVSYLATAHGRFSADQKTWLLRALLSVFSADGRFNEDEHDALIDYTAAIGFDRQSAVSVLRGVATQFARGDIV